MTSLIQENTADHFLLEDMSEDVSSENTPFSMTKVTLVPTMIINPL